MLRNYPVIGHLRFLLEFIRPEIRQYFIESDNEAVPFSRQQRSLVYQRAKGQPDKRPFGTQLDVQAAIGYEWINHSLQPTSSIATTISASPSAKAAAPALQRQRLQHLGDELRRAVGQRHPGAQRRRTARRLRARHRRGLDQPHHREHGGDLIWEIGSGYFGCRHDDGRFSEERFARTPRTRRSR
jgi:glutamate synthase domain-containing protein 2